MDYEKETELTALEAEANKNEKKNEEKTEDAERHGWLGLTEEEKADVMEYAEGYMSFLDAAKTEREAVKTVRHMAEFHGFREIGTVKELRPGDRV